ncbi:MAG TPA: putative peptidoglycan glycosyltransferase FtsW [Pseudogracilibacillus sp.]|nr:putative peptidoglycan glycosyltransferase FtsW [Pseudogracilibacillus sp.]
MRNRLKNYDFLLIIVPLLLAAFGIVMIYSASMVTAVVSGLDSTYYVVKQAQWFGLGLVVFILCLLIPYQSYQKLVIPLIILSVISLLIVPFFGKTVYNATRTIVLLGFNIQPSEFVKLFLIIYLASVYSKKQSYIDNLSKGVIPPLVLSLFIIGLIVIQPDLGTASIILFIIAMIIISSGIRFKHVMLLGTVAAGVIMILIPLLVTETRIRRFTGAYNPFADPDSAGYHLIQSYLAISGGGVTGEGLGQSIQKLGYLWGAHTDFIMSIIAEELGALGVIIVIGAIVTITLRGLYFARKCTDSFGTLLAIGISSMIGFQAIVNLGAISGVLPITGVTLPFVSYGGSSLLILMASMGILNNIAKQVKIEENKPKVIEKDPIDEIKHRSGTRWSM